jgi:branched-chain amino acid transport system permease protein
MNRKKLLSIISLAILICLLFALPVLWKNLYWTHVLILTMITVLMAASLRALARTGQISMGSAGFMLVGAYSSALLVLKAGISVWVAMPLGGLFSAVLALIVGYPFLRAKGIYFAILTVMLSEVCRLIAWYWSSMTGGYTGLNDIPAPNPINIFGITTLNFNTKIAYYYLVLVIVIIGLVILYRMERSWLGLIWASIKEADNLAQSVGINIMGHKMLIFSISSFFMGLAGAMYAHYLGTLTPLGTPGSPFSFTASIYLILYMMVGGEASFAGPIIGTYLLKIVPETARQAQEYMPLIFGGLLIFVVFVAPEGIMGLRAPLSRLWRKLTAKYMPKARGIIKEEWLKAR